MATASQSGKVTPERIFSTLVSYQQGEALKAAMSWTCLPRLGRGRRRRGRWRRLLALRNGGRGYWRIT